MYIYIYIYWWRKVTSRRTTYFHEHIILWWYDDSLPYKKHHSFWQISTVLAVVPAVSWLVFWGRMPWMETVPSVGWPTSQHPSCWHRVWLCSSLEELDTNQPNQPTQPNPTRPDPTRPDPTQPNPTTNRNSPITTFQARRCWRCGQLFRLFGLYQQGRSRNGASAERHAVGSVHHQGVPDFFFSKIPQVISWTMSEKNIFTETFGRFFFSGTRRPRKNFGILIVSTFFHTWVFRNVCNKKALGTPTKASMDSWISEKGWHTVDGWNPAPVDRYFVPLFSRFYTSQVVQDFFHQQYECFTQLHSTSNIVWFCFSCIVQSLFCFLIILQVLFFQHSGSSLTFSRQSHFFWESQYLLDHVDGFSMQFCPSRTNLTPISSY